MDRQIDLEQMIKEVEACEKEYKELLNSGMLFEWYPQLTGDYERDFNEWAKIYNELLKIRKQQ